MIQSQLKSWQRLMPLDWFAVQLHLDNWVACKNFWLMVFKHPTIYLEIKTYPFLDQISAELAPNILRGQIICVQFKFAVELVGTWNLDAGFVKKNGEWLENQETQCWVIIEFMRVGKTGNLWLESWCRTNIIEIQTNQCNLLATHLFPPLKVRLVA